MIFVDELHVIIRCSASGGARVAAGTLHVPWFETCSADGFEALHTATGSRGLWRWFSCVRALAHCGVTIQRKHVIWGPAGWAASPSTDEFHLHSQRLGTCKLRALFCIGLSCELRRAAICD